MYTCIIRIVTVEALSCRLYCWCEYRVANGVILSKFSLLLVVVY